MTEGSTGWHIDTADLLMEGLAGGWLSDRHRAHLGTCVICRSAWRDVRGAVDGERVRVRRVAESRPAVEWEARRSAIVSGAERAARRRDAWPTAVASSLLCIALGLVAPDFLNRWNDGSSPATLAQEEAWLAELERQSYGVEEEGVWAVLAPLPTEPSDGREP